MDVFETIRTVLAVREYADKPIPAELVQRILESAWLTGSSRNGQPWHFVAVQDREMLTQLGAIATSGPYTAGAALAVIVAIEKDSPYGVSDGSRAIQSMMLTAWAEGVGSNWVGYLGYGGLDQVNALLGIPEEYATLAIIPFGYPVQELGKGKKRRKPFGEVVHEGRFGEPFA